MKLSPDIDHLPVSAAHEVGGWENYADNHSRLRGADSLAEAVVAYSNIRVDLRNRAKSFAPGEYQELIEESEVVFIGTLDRLGETACLELELE